MFFFQFFFVLLLLCVPPFHHDSHRALHRQFGHGAMAVVEEKETFIFFPSAVFFLFILVCRSIQESEREKDERERMRAYSEAACRLFVLRTWWQFAPKNLSESFPRFSYSFFASFNFGNDNLPWVITRHQKSTEIIFSQTCSRAHSQRSD